MSGTDDLLKGLSALSPVASLFGGGSTKVTQSTSLSSISNTLLNISNTSGGQGGNAAGSPVSNSAYPSASSSDGSGLGSSAVPSYGAFNTGSGSDALLSNNSGANAGTVTPLNGPLMYAGAAIMGLGLLTFLFKRRK